MENEEAIAEFLGYMRSIDWQTSEMVRTFRGIESKIEALTSALVSHGDIMIQIRDVLIEMRNENVNDSHPADWEQ